MLRSPRPQAAAGTPRRARAAWRSAGLLIAAATRRAGVNKPICELQAHEAQQAVAAGAACASQLEKSPALHLPAGPGSHPAPSAAPRPSCRGPVAWLPFRASALPCPGRPWCAPRKAVMAASSQLRAQAACGTQAAAAAAGQRRPAPPARRQRRPAARRRPLHVASAASVELDMDVTSSVDIENIEYEDGLFTVQARGRQTSGWLVGWPVGCPCGARAVVAMLFRLPVHAALYRSLAPCCCCRAAC